MAWAGVGVVGMSLEPSSDPGSDYCHVSSMKDGGALANDGRVKPGDKLVRVDGFDCMGVTELAQTLLEQKLFFSCASCKTACALTSTPFPSIHPFAYACSTRTCSCRNSPPGSYHPVHKGAEKEHPLKEAVTNEHSWKSEEPKCGELRRDACCPSWRFLCVWRPVS